MRTPARWGVPFVLAIALVAIACGRELRVCEPIPWSAAASDRYEELAAALDFSPTPPCSFRSDVEVVRVLGSTVPGASQPRISFVAERRGERGFVYSATTAQMPFTAIPQGTRRLRTTTGDVIASGFAGPSGGGEDIAYLRWRFDGVTYELAATLRSWLTEADVQAIARALIGESVTAEG